jgi:hypothetical protein
MANQHHHIQNAVTTGNHLTTITSSQLEMGTIKAYEWQ